MALKFIVVLIGIFILSACGTTGEVGSIEPAMPASTITQALVIPSPTSPPANPLGTLSLEENQVLHGQDEKALVPLLESASFYEKDFIQVIEGGEAVLDFGDMMRLRLFNDTQLEMVSAEIVDDIPLGVQVYLFVGGFTGRLTQEGGKAVFRTPGNVEITILGTEYYIVYDPETEITYAGNFGGTTEVASAGSQVSLEDGFYVTVPANSPPSPPVPIPYSLEGFEIRAREESSPVQAAKQAGEWSLEIRHEFTVDVEGSISNQLRLWSGQFTLDGNTIVGSGTGIIDNQNITCPIIERTKFNIVGSFDFDIGGQLITGESGLPTFMMEITTRNVEMTKSLDLESCNGFINAVQDLNIKVTEDPKLQGMDTISIVASPGAKTTFELDLASKTNEKSIYLRTPLVVTVYSVQ